MKTRSTALYVSVALNAVLVAAVVFLPRTRYDVAFGQVAESSGAYSAVSTKSGGGSRDVLWMADRASGRLAAYQYVLSSRAESPLQRMDVRDLRQDLLEAQVGNLLLISVGISSSNSLVCVIDTDSEKMAVYEFDPSSDTIQGIQQTDLRVDFGKVRPPEMQPGR